MKRKTSPGFYQVPAVVVLRNRTVQQTHSVRRRQGPDHGFPPQANQQGTDLRAGRCARAEADERDAGGVAGGDGVRWVGVTLKKPIFVAKSLRYDIATRYIHCGWAIDPSGRTTAPK